MATPDQSDHSLNHPIIQSPNSLVVLFDGVCNLCNGAVKFIIKRDPAAKFKFASLQSAYGKSQLIRFGLDPDALHSIVVVENDVAYQRSDAALRIAGNLNGPWSMARVFSVIPRFIRDWVYDLIASNRYKVFGRRDSCMIPDAAMKARFLE